MAEVTGLEPATPSVTSWYSNQLSYTSAQDLTLIMVGSERLELTTYAV
jgi:hypothetical protein